jgi:acyl-CoA reductase-like NAD-dependent aldehyde dehydrogenase
MGNPRDPETFIGPMISEKEATRLGSWIEHAHKRGGKLLCGGKREGAMLEATLLEDVPRDCDVVSKEAFGPAAVLSKFSDFDVALKQVNDSVFGLQAGIFTRDLFKALRAWEELDVGGVVIGDVPSWRVDHMPYGGVKDSGLGREGIQFAMEDMTEIRLLVIREPGA